MENERCLCKNRSMGVGVSNWPHYGLTVRLNLSIISQTIDILPSFF